MEGTEHEGDGSTRWLLVNGTVHAVEAEPWVTLLDLLRERLGLFGTKKGV